MVSETFVILKPDTVKRNLIGRVIQRFEDAGLSVGALAMAVPGRAFWRKFYAGLEERIPEESYKSQIEFMASGMVVFMVLEGDDAIERVRKLIGKTNPREAAPGTIRGDFGSSLPGTLVHASDSLESFQRELKLFLETRWSLFKL